MDTIFHTTAPRRPAKKLPRGFAFLFAGLFLLSACGEPEPEPIPEIRGNSVGNIVQNGLCAAGGGWHYYADDGALWKLPEAGGEPEQLLEGDVSFINVVEDRLYFILDGAVCAMNTDGNGVAEIPGCRTDGYLQYVDGWLYYRGARAEESTAEDGSPYTAHLSTINRVKPDGSEQAELLARGYLDNMQVLDGHVYYTTHWGEIQSTAYRIPIEGVGDGEPEWMHWSGVIMMQVEPDAVFSGGFYGKAYGYWYDPDITREPRTGDDDRVMTLTPNDEGSYCFQAAGDTLYYSSVRNVFGEGDIYHENLYRTSIGWDARSDTEVVWEGTLGRAARLNICGEWAYLFTAKGTDGASLVARVHLDEPNWGDEA